MMGARNQLTVQYVHIIVHNVSVCIPNSTYNYNVNIEMSHSTMHMYCVNLIRFTAVAAVLFAQTNHCWVGCVWQK